MVEKHRKEIGSRIKEVRKFLRLTQQEVSTITGLSLGFISETENGKKRPSSIYLFFLAEKYDVNINYILVGKGDMVTRDELFEKSRNLDFGRDREIIEELLYYLENSDLARYSILKSFIEFKRDNEYLKKGKESSD